MKTSARDLYAQKKTERGRELAAIERRVNRIATARLVVVVAAVGLVVASVWSPFHHGPGWAAGFFLGFFILLVIFHHRAFEAKRGLEARQRFYDRGLLRLEGGWTKLRAGEGYKDDRHPYASDLDLFGHASVFQRIDATETRFGEERLVAWLKGETGNVELQRARQHAVRELTPALALREDLSALGALLSEEKPDPTPFIAWADGTLSLAATTWLKFSSTFFPLVTLALVLGAPIVHWPRLSALLSAAIGLAATAHSSRRVRAIAAAVSSREASIARYGDLFAVLERAYFDSPYLRRLRDQLEAHGTSATRELARLSRIVSFLDARQNEVFRLFIAPLLLWDLNCVLRLEHWRLRAGSDVRGWFESLAEIEACASLAGFAFESEDEVTWPELNDGVVYVAEGLAHPLIAADRRVRNDVRFSEPGEALVVTGSNMSGKSTLLRAMGVNAVLAFAGGPVCARRFLIGPLAVCTSMRVSDSLEEGVSHFYAELRKLKMIVERARSGAPVLFLLDEILHGTNSRERVIGARAIVHELLRCGAIGAVSTHDLKIADVETELSGRVKNVHFEEQVVSDQMTFDYKLRDGVVTSSNALRLMKLVGLDVVP